MKITLPDMNTVLSAHTHIDTNSHPGPDFSLLLLLLFPLITAPEGYYLKNKIKIFEKFLEKIFTNPEPKPTCLLTFV